jgi:hypothetical protein
MPRLRVGNLVPRGFANKGFYLHSPKQPLWGHSVNHKDVDQKGTRPGPQKVVTNNRPISEGWVSPKQLLDGSSVLLIKKRRGVVSRPSASRVDAGYFVVLKSRVVSAASRSPTGSSNTSFRRAARGPRTLYCRKGSERFSRTHKRRKPDGVIDLQNKSTSRHSRLRHGAQSTSGGRNFALF